MNTRRTSRPALVAAWAFLIACGSTQAQEILVPSLPSGQPVGTPVTWRVESPEPGAFHYRLSVSRNGGPARLVFDFGAKSEFGWTPIEEGSYELIASLRARSNGLVTELREPFSVLARATLAPVVNATAHPLVALYSAPPCPAARWLRVHFLTFAPVKKYFATDWRPCDGARSMNLYLAGMLADSNYFVRHEVRDLPGVDRSFGPVLQYRSGTLPGGLVNLAAIPPTAATTSIAESVVIAAPIVIPPDTRPQMPLATDLAGRVLWYYQAEPQARAQIWRPLPGGAMLISFNAGAIWQGLREVDLAGQVIRETSAERVSEQLIALGRDPITSIHHEAIRLPNGHTAIIGSMERMYQDVQGVSGPVDVMADAVIVLDLDWQVVWAWSGYDHLDISRAAVLDEKCGTIPANNAGCPPVRLVDGVNTLANDWMHSNSIGYSPADGNLIVSMRHQDWVIKLDYRDGSGAGAVLWRLGRDGDFAMAGGGAEPFPWFSHQHDANYYAADRIVLFDNANTPCEQGLGACMSRGQAYLLDETALAATRVLNAELGVYAEAVGSAQALRNGNFYFHAGILGLPPPPVTRVVEVTPAGAHSYVADFDVASYRSFRLVSLYLGVPGAPN